MFMLVFAAIGVFGAGMLAIAAGIPIKDYGFGNTLILSGVIAWCTSIIMVSLWVCAREIRQVFEQPSDADAQKRDQTAAAANAASDQGGWPQSIPEKTPAQPAAEPPAADTKPGRRNLLFASSRRTAAAGPESAPPAQAVAAPEPRTPEPRPAESRGPAAEEPRPTPKRAEVPARPLPRTPLNLGSLRDTPRTPAGAAAAPASTSSSASASGSASPPREPAPEPAATPSRSPEAAPTPPATAPGRSDSVGVNVLKSGVVDGMAYWLYSDGSIEAQMAEGMMRFGSIDELRAHLDKRA
jgi:hypothetical protein